MIELEIDGKTVRSPQGSMIIEAADGAGIYIPRFCYHKKLSIAANCRMCLVDDTQTYMQNMQQLSTTTNICFQSYSV